MRDYRQSPSFWTYALFSQRKTLIGSSMEICQHLSKTCQPLSTHDIITIYWTNNWSRTDNSTEQITRVAPVEATKKKANPATDEVRMETRNHGLAWSQSGNNRTVATLLSLFKSDRQERNYSLQSKDSHYLQKNKRQLKLSHIAIIDSWYSFSLSCNPFFEIWISLSVLLKTLTNWAQRDKPLQETITFTAKKKIA